MSFGRNPFVIKAQVAEQKAEDATDDASRLRAYRDAAHEWDRAARRESVSKRREEYEQNAHKNRSLADAGAVEIAEPAEVATGAAVQGSGTAVDLRSLN